MDTLEYGFEELPVFSELGFEFGSLTGKATIRFDATGEWSVGEIYLEGSRRTHPIESITSDSDRLLPMFVTKLDRLCEKSHPELYLSIVHHLEHGRWKEAIQDAVNKELGWSGIRMPTDRDHSTHYAALSGVAS